MEQAPSQFHALAPMSPLCDSSRYRTPHCLKKKKRMVAILI